jgi:lipoic acid synthetase
MHLAVEEFIHPDLFAEYKEVGLQKGFKFVESGALVRSSYHAERHI